MLLCSRRSLLLAAAALLTAPLVAGDPAGGARSTKKVLMIGNSYTNGGWTAIQGFANADPAVTLQLEVAANGGWTTERHYDSRLQKSYDGGAKSLEDKLRQEPWDFVVIQEQSTRPSQAWIAPGVERTGFQYGMLHLDAYVRQEAPTATVMYFQTWPRDWGSSYLRIYFHSDPVEMQQATNGAYFRAAQATGSEIVPVGSAWAYSMVQRGGLQLHAGDGSHAGPAGKYLTGAIFYSFFFDKSPLASSFSAGLPAADEQWMLWLADQTWQRFG